MSQHQHQHQHQHQQHGHGNSSGGGSGNANIPVSEVYWSLVDKADKKFSKIRDLPFYERQRYDTYFYKVFKVYTQLWKFQQENRQKLVESGLKRWEIGEIASRIAQLYFGQYMRTSEASYLSESYIFYEAILTREYFKEGLCQDLNLANKQLRFLARFLMVCLVYNKREMVNQLVSQLKSLVDECKRTFQDTDFKEWKLVVQEINRFLKADTAFMNTRPLRYSLALDPNTDSLPRVAASITNRNLRLRDAILSSYHHNEVKFSELTLDTFRMLQCLEWEPSGSFYQSPGTKLGASAHTRTNHSQDIVDHTLPPNPRKAVLYRPSVTHFVAVLATICEELPPDGVLLLYLSASGRRSPISLSAGVGAFSDATENITRNLQTVAISSDETSCITSGSLSDDVPPSGQGKGDCMHHRSPCLQFGNRNNGGSNCIYPCDLLPFTRRPLVLIVDSDSSLAFEAIHGAEKGEPAALLLSPRSLAPTVVPDFSRCPGGSLFTVFLTAPLQAFCILLGFSSSEIHMEVAEKFLSSSLNDWGLALAKSDSLNPVWAQILNDPFLRRLLIRFLFCQAVLSLYIPTSGKEEFLPKCLPSLPKSFMPASVAVQSVVRQIASIFSVDKKFNFSEAIPVSESGESDSESISSS